MRKMLLIYDLNPLFQLEAIIPNTLPVQNDSIQRNQSNLFWIFEFELKVGITFT